MFEGTKRVNQKP